MLAERGIEPIETVETAVRFGIAMETPKAYVNRTFARPSVGS